MMLMSRVKNRCQASVQYASWKGFWLCSFSFSRLSLSSSFFSSSPPYAHAQEINPSNQKMNHTSERKRAKYISSSKPAESTPRYSFCESVTATSHSPWHIRKLDPAGKKLGGGITSPSLCSFVERGWDLEVDINDFHLANKTCKRCVAEYVKLQLKPA